MTTGSAPRAGALPGSETTVLVVEDDSATRRLVRRDLERVGMQVTEAGTVAQALEALRSTVFDVIILDLTLPDGSGLDILAWLREGAGSTHVIVLSGASTQFDRVHGLESGADDYVVKPFYARELTARVMAVRRQRDAQRDTTLRLGHLQIDVAARSVVVDGHEVELTGREFTLLAFLAARPGHVFSRNELLRSVWRSAPDWQTPATVTEHIRRLRSKIEADPSHPRFLRTVRGSGYRFDAPAADHPPVEEATGPALTGVLIAIGGRVVESDVVADALLGTTDGTGLVGRELLDLVAPQSEVAARRRLEARLAGEEPRSQLLTLVGGGGVELPIELRSELTRWHGREAVRLELRLAPSESLRLRRQVTGVLSEVTDSVIVTDPQLHIRSWNGGAERLYGWNESEVLGCHLQDVIECLDDSIEVARAALHESGRWHGLCRQRGRDGSVIRISSSMKLLRDDDGAEAVIVSVNRRAEPDWVGGPQQTDADTVELRRGLEHGELEVHYQPVVELATRRIITLEALVRWNHPERGLLTPSDFLATAERSDLILQLGAFVLDTACRQTQAWRRDGIDTNIAVNLSARELAEPSIVELVTSTSRAAGLDLRFLWLEITESSLVADVALARRRLEELTALGVGISIDDFGTGWASLTYLREFPVHVLKIDRSFVTGIEHDAANVAIARSILSLAAELNLVVVAEGIETEAEHQILRDLGCAVGQGYLYGRPVPADEVDFSRRHRAVPGESVTDPSLTA